MIKIISLSLLVILFNHCTAQSGATKDSSRMIFMIKLSDEAKANAGNIVVNLEFKNIINDEIKILDVFDPIPVFFAIKIIKEDGTVFTPPGAGKIAFTKDSLPVVSISANQSYYKQFNLSTALEKYNIVLPEGHYRLKISYHNQYGKNCIKGWFNSNEIEMEITK